MPTASSTVVTLGRSAGLNHVLAAAASILLGLFGVVWAATGHARVLVGVLGAVLLAVGALLAWGVRAAADRLVFDADAVSRSVGPRQLWRLRWQHMAAVRFGRGGGQDGRGDGQDDGHGDDGEDAGDQRAEDGGPGRARDGRPNALWLVPLAAIVGHPEIAPALQPRPIDGRLQPTFEVTLGFSPKVRDAVRGAVERHAPPHLLPDQSNPRPPST